jgi:hypothetical protein
MYDRHTLLKYYVTLFITVVTTESMYNMLMNKRIGYYISRTLIVQAWVGGFKLKIYSLKVIPNTNINVLIPSRV